MLTLPDLQVLSMLVHYIVESNDESMALLGVSLLQQLMQAAGPHIDAEGWEQAVDAFQRGCSFSSLETLLSDRCNALPFQYVKSATIPALPERGETS